MDESEDQRLYREDAHALAQIGAVLDEIELPRITVRLPAELARAAVAAWEREDDGEVESESFEQRVMRHRAACLAVIGQAVKYDGSVEGEYVVVDLSAETISMALDASDDLVR